MNSEFAFDLFSAQNATEEQHQADNNHNQPVKVQRPTKKTKPVRRKSITIVCDEETRRRFKIEAIICGQTMTDFICAAVEAYIKRKNVNK